MPLLFFLLVVIPFIVITIPYAIGVYAVLGLIEFFVFKIPQSGCLIIVINTVLSVVIGFLIMTQSIH